MPMRRPPLGFSTQTICFPIADAVMAGAYTGKRPHKRCRTAHVKSHPSCVLTRNEFEFTSLHMAYRRTERVQEQLLDKRDRILQAVRAVVSEVGFRGAQVAIVAEAAEVATGTVYRHFPSKSELFAEALALNAGHEVSVMQAVADSEGTATARLADAVRVFALRAMRARPPARGGVAGP